MNKYDINDTVILITGAAGQLGQATITAAIESGAKLICLDQNLKELGTWGPRPKFLQDWMYENKANPKMEMSELKEQFQIWYTKDKGQTLQKEMILLLKSWTNKECFSL